MGKRIAVAVAILSAMVLMLVLYWPDMQEEPPGITMVPATAVIGGPFTLADTKGNTVTDADLKGHYSLIYFGYTHCPDICPVTLQAMTQALNAVGPVAQDIQPVFITVDPERDTPDALASYIANFDPHFIALTGTADQVRAAVRSYKGYAAKVPVKDEAGKDTGDYMMSHTGYIYLMDRDGKYLTQFSSSAPADEIAARLRQLPHA